MDKTLGEKLCYFRNRANLKQNELAKLAEISPTALNYYEKDKREPSVPILTRLIKALGISGNDIFSTNDAEDALPIIYAPTDDGEVIEALEGDELADAIGMFASLPPEALGDMKIIAEFLHYKYSKTRKDN